MTLLHETTHHRPHEAHHGAQTAFGPSTIAAVIALAVALAVVTRLVVHRLDRNRIRAYAERNGWQLESCSWRLFGPGWFGSRRERIYEICYRDGEGRSHEAFAKTSALAGVYLTEDRVV